MDWPKRSAAVGVARRRQARKEDRGVCSFCAKGERPFLPRTPQAHRPASKTRRCNSQYVVVVVTLRTAPARPRVRTIHLASSEAEISKPLFSAHSSTHTGAVCARSFETQRSCSALRLQARINLRRSITIALIRVEDRSRREWNGCASLTLTGQMRRTAHRRLQTPQGDG
jgi:hypothetical protein